jgi:hypothetical protein
MSGSNFQVTTSGAYVIYSGGVKYTKSTTQQVAISNDQTLHFVYFDTSGTIQVSMSAWDLLADTVPIALVFKDSTTYRIFDERHSYDRNRQYHKQQHESVGAVHISGYVGTFNNTTFSITQGVVADEDIQLDSGGTKTDCAMWYRNTGLTSMRTEAGISTPWRSNAGAPQYDNAGTMTNVGTAKYFVSWFYGTTDATYPVYLVSGQAQYNTIADARNAGVPTILLNTAEWKLLYKVIYQESSGSATYKETYDYRRVSTGPVSAYLPTDHASLLNRDAASSHPATAVSNTPAGNIAATTVQAAIDELDTEKIAISTLTTAGDLLYRTTVPARLAIGTAYQKLRVNSGATAPEWATDREVLSAARTYYVRTDGNDSNTGLADTSGGAFLTIGKAMTVAQTLDLNGYVLNVFARSGTYTAPVVLPEVVGYWGPGSVNLIGDTTTPANVIISTTSAHAITAASINTIWQVQGFKLQTTTSGSCVYVGAAVLYLYNIDFGAAATGAAHMFTSSGQISMVTNYKISGAATYHIYCTGPKSFVNIANRTLTIDAGGSALAFSYFVYCAYLAGIYAYSNTFTLVGGTTVTGTRFIVFMNAMIFVNGASVSYFPGNVNGTAPGSTGGQYA